MRDEVYIIQRSRVYNSRCCPQCGEPAKRSTTGVRKIKDVSLKRPCILQVTYSTHYCEKCNKHFNAPMEDLAAKGSMYSKQAYRLVMARLREDRLNVKLIQRQMSRDFNLKISDKTIYRWGNIYL